MGRNSSGTYTLPESPFVPSTPISSAAVNSDFDDVADALTDSLSRTGQGGMLAALPMANAGFTYSSDPDTGMSRSGANTQVITCGGTNTVLINSTGVSVTGNLGVSGTILAGGNALIPVGMGPLQWSGTTAPGGWVFAGATYSRTTYAALWAFAQAEIALGNTFYTNGNGTTTFTIATMDGYAPAGVDAAGARITSFTHVGDVAGAASKTLSTANLPAYTPSGSITNGQVLIGGSSSLVRALQNSTTYAPNAGSPTGALNDTLPITQQASSFVGAAQGGTSTPFSIVQPSRAFNYIIYAGV